MDSFTDNVEYPRFEKTLEKSILNCAKLNQHDSVQYYIDKWLAICKSDEQKAYIHLRAGNILAAEDRFDWALEIYQQGMKITPLQTTLKYQLNLRLGFTLVQTGDIGEAERYAQSAAKIYPDQAGGHLVLGLVQEHQKDYGNAIETYMAATLLPIHDQDWMSLLGQYTHYLGKTKDQNISKTDPPNLPAPLRILGAIYVLTGGNEKKTILPDSLQAKLCLQDTIWQELYLPLLNEMLPTLERPGNPNVHCLQGLFQRLDNGKIQIIPKGIQFKETFHRSAPEKHLSSDMNGYITPDGLMLFDGYLEARNRFLEFLNSAVGYFLERQDREQVENKMAIIHELSFSARDYAIFWLKKGSAMERFKEYKDAAEAYQEGLTYEHDDTKLNYFMHNNLGFSLIQVGQYIEAEDFCRKAIKIEWDQHNAHKNLSLALKGQGRCPEAAESLIQSTKIWPYDRRASDHLRELLEIQPDLETTHPQYHEFLDYAQVVIDHAFMIGKCIKSMKADTSSLPRPLRILIAAAQVVGETGRKVFTPEELRLRIKAEKQSWEMVYTPTLREMSNGLGEKEIDELKGYRGIFQMQSLTEIRFTEKGELLAELIGVIIQGARES